MTVLSVAKDVAAECGLDIPIAVATSSKREHVELMEVMNEAAKHIAKAHEWQVLTAEVSFTGNSAVVAFPLPFNFDRMKRDVKPWNVTTNLPLIRVNEASKWHEMERMGGDTVYQRSIVLNNNLYILPILATDVSVQLYYQSKNFAESAALVPKPNFTADDDVFRVDDRLLKLFTVALWKGKNGQASAAGYLTLAEKLLGELSATDMGVRTTTSVKAA